MDQILTSLVSLGYLVEKWPFCSTRLFSLKNAVGREGHEVVRHLRQRLGIRLYCNQDLLLRFSGIIA